MKEYYKAMKFLSSLFISCLLAVLIGIWLDKKLHCIPSISAGIFSLCVACEFLSAAERNERR